MNRDLVLVLALVPLAACSDDPAMPAPASATDAGPTADADVPDGNTGEVTPPRRMFLTQSLRTGANGGVAGADLLCAEEAQRAKLSGEFIAWLSTPTAPIAGRLRADAAFMTTDGKILWQERSEIQAGKPPAFPITADAYGQPLTATTNVWTGTNANGAATGQDCQTWTTNSVSMTGTAGVFGATDAKWTDDGPKDCARVYPLLCVEK